MKWYSIRRFRCSRCDQRLAVHSDQIDRGEVVTCQNCNLDMLLTPKGKAEEARSRAQPDWQVVEL